MNLDGFYLSFTREPVEVPNPEAVRAFLPQYTPRHPVFRASRPVAQGVGVLEPASYSYFRYQSHLAVRNALEVHTEAAADFLSRFGRNYGAIEADQIDDAEIVLVMSGSFSTKAKGAIRRWRRAGRRVGLLRLRMVRPWPAADVIHALDGRGAVGVIDQNISPGLGGILFHELASTLAAAGLAPRVLRSFIGGLGGKNIGPAEFDHVLDVLESASPGTGPIEPELLFTRHNWEQVRDRQEIAGKPVGVGP